MFIFSLLRGVYIKRENLVGRKFGKLTVTEMLYNYKGSGRTKCLCLCDCGNTCIRTAYSLKKCELSSCGCDRKERAKKVFGKDINGKRFGRLVVLETFWELNPIKVKCKCDCGNVVILRKGDVQKMHTQSCGCLQKENTSKANDVDHTNKVSDYGIKIISKSHKNNLDQWLWKCKCGYCGKTFTDIPARILGNHVRSCGCLKTSSNELFIKSILDEHNIKYKTQYTFPDCKGYTNYPLYFDFAIFNNDNLLCLIEFDGQQHFFPNDLFGGKEEFVKTKERDEMKNKYCKDNNIKLYRFPYTINNIELKKKIINIVNP